VSNDCYENNNNKRVDLVAAATGDSIASLHAFKHPHSHSSLAPSLSPDFHFLPPPSFSYHHSHSHCAIASASHALTGHASHFTLASCSLQAYLPRLRQPKLDFVVLSSISAISPNPLHCPPCLRLTTMRLLREAETEVSAPAYTDVCFHAPRICLHATDFYRLLPKSRSRPSLNSTAPSPATHNLTMTNSHTSVKSDERIPKSLDQTMDKQIPSNGHVEPGVSIRMGPVEEMDIDPPPTNGTSNGKRKARSSLTNGRTYKEASSSDDDDDKPLVRSMTGPSTFSTLTLFRVSGVGRLSKTNRSGTNLSQTSATCR
jgi:hypothetical protein